MMGDNVSEFLLLLIISASVFIVVATFLHRQFVGTSYLKHRLALSVAGSRFYWMLKMFDIPFQQFIHKSSVYDIAQHITRCQQCKSLASCDRCLRRDRQHADLSFCPNYSHLVKFKAHHPNLHNL